MNHSLRRTPSTQDFSDILDEHFKVIIIQTLTELKKTKDEDNISQKPLILEAMEK